jgi:hypothetical protein
VTGKDQPSNCATAAQTATTHGSNAWLKRRTAALNLRNLIKRGLDFTQGWILATILLGFEARIAHYLNVACVLTEMSDTRPPGQPVSHWPLRANPLTSNKSGLGNTPGTLPPATLPAQTG